MKVKVNDHYSFEVEVSHKVLKIDDQELNIDIASLSNGHKSILYQNRSYNIELVSEDKVAKTSVIRVNGNTYHVDIEDQYDQLLKKLGLDTAMAVKILEIKAPMPGLVLNVVVVEGQEVNKGDNLLVLEAMKMENIIKSPSGGIVKRILVNTGDKVEKNQILIQFS